MLTSARRASVALATVATLTAATLLTPGTAGAEAGLLCRAHMSDSTPKQYTHDDVQVRSRPHARVHTVAHYKTTNTAHNARANGRGRATIDYYISGATPGYRVHVDVTVRRGGRTGHCSTWFTPHR